jgi:carbon monoxide dehydrogenase subunit G
MTLQFEVNKPLAVVFEYLTNMQRFVEVHPVIYKIDTIAPYSYRMHETLKLLFLPISFSYPATVEVEKEHIVMKAVVYKIVHIMIQFDLKASEKGTIIDETIDFDTFLPIKFFMSAMFKKVHRALFERIERI